MRVPDSVASAYEEALAVAEPLRQFASTRLRVICAANNWLFDDRIKGQESCLSKLEAGGGPLSELNDLYAATIVVPTQNELDSAVAAVFTQFDGKVKAVRTKSAEEFIYDDIHVLAQLGDKVSPAVVSQPISARTFEIQVRTGLQYAWWRATHDQVYKSSSDEGHGWGVRRVSGQAKASLELLDNILADLTGAGRRQRLGPQDETPESGPRDWLARWNPSLHPTDVHRFTTTVDGLMKACSVSNESVEAAFATQEIECLIDRPELTPGQVVVAAIHSLVGREMSVRLQVAKRRVLVTNELILHYPQISNIVGDAVVNP